MDYHAFMLISRVFAVTLAAWVMMSAPPAYAQDYPAKPVRIVTSAAGGGNDFMARLIGGAMSGPLGQQVVVDNRGGSSVIPGELVSKAAPDGYTILFASSSLWLAPLLQKVSYDPVRDLAPITLIDRAPNILVVHPSLPVRSVKELIALARARPGELNYSSARYRHVVASRGRIVQVDGRRQRGARRLQGQRTIDECAAGGEAHAPFATATSVGPHLKAERLKPLAVTTAEPTALLPGLSTLAAAGLPGYEAASTDGMFAPAKTPAAIIERLHQEIVRAINRPEVKEKFLNTGVEMIGGGPEAFAAAIRLQVTRMSKVIKDAGIRAD